ncbi:MAG: thioesterase family protein [Eubacterium sp.]|nr:thioesterase family protein [Eubacterium sp.]
METGIKNRAEIIVTEEMTAAAAGSGLLPVYGTPFLVALMENTAHTSITEELTEGQGTVGTRMDVRHLAATPVGMKVTCESELTEVDRRRLVFTIKAYDEAGLIAEAVHERFIIDNERFLAKAEAKRK